MQFLVRNFATSKETHQRHIAQSATHDLQLSAFSAKVRATTASTAHVNRASHAACRVWVGVRISTQSACQIGRHFFWL